MPAVHSDTILRDAGGPQPPPGDPSLDDHKRGRQLGGAREFRSAKRLNSSGRRYVSCSNSARAAFEAGLQPLKKIFGRLKREHHRFLREIKARRHLSAYLKQSSVRPWTVKT